jgi:tetratricopeptide (TPR) repeat protein
VLLSQTGDKRSAVNLAWEWIGIAVLWFLLRATTATHVQRAQLGTLLLATSSMLAAFGIWQHYVWYEDHIRIYELPRNELDVLLAASEPRSARDLHGIQRLEQRLISLGVPPECLKGPGRKGFESRLLHSREPLGAFALTNSLAGLLLPHLVIGCVIVVTTWRSGGKWSLVALGTLLLGAIAFCLILTKCRTAYVGLMVGVAFWFCYRWWFGDAGEATGSVSKVRRGWMMALGLGAFVVGAGTLVGFAVQSGGLDWLVLAQAPKSLKYRIEYWSGTWDVLTARTQNWLVGIGPGNFRQHYLRFKLPESSEEIADPHQLLLDVWVNGGLLGVTGLLVLLWTILRLLTPQATRFVQHAPDSCRIHNGSGSQSMPLRNAILLAGLLAVAAGVWLSVPKELVAIGLLIVWGAAAAVWLQTQKLDLSDRRQNWTIGIALLALVIHLVGAGGIAMPAITVTCLAWLCLGEGTDDPASERDPASAKPSLPSRWRPLAVVSLMVILNVACFFSATKPVGDRRALEESAMTAVSADNNFALAESRLRRAIEADRWSPDPRQKLGDLLFRRWLTQPESPDAWVAGVEAYREAIGRDPRQPGLHRALGRWQAMRFEKTRDVQDAIAAVQALSIAAELYPNSPGIQADLAEAAAAAGHRDRAIEASQRALQLDLIYLQAKHTDKLLDTKQRRRLEEMQSLPKVQSSN